MPKRTGRLLLGVDVGSSGVKAILLDPATGIVASASRAVSLFSEHPGWSEADPEAWWRALCDLVPELLALASVTAVDVEAVAVSGMVPAVVVVGDDARPLRRAMLQNDARATEEIKELGERLLDVDLLDRTGSVLSQQSIAPSALWLARHEPDVWAATTSIQGSYDWLARRLGASAHVEENWALEGGLYDLAGAPVPEVLAATRLRWPALLEARRPGEVVGEVHEFAATATGLAAGTAIVVGGADHVLSAYGAGLLEAGDCLIKLGGAGDVLCVSDRIVVDRRLYLDRHPMPEKWLPNGCMATSGSLLRWEQSLLGDASLAVLDDQARIAEPGALLSLPYFLGEKTPLHDPDLRGVILGLHLGTTRGDLHRSFLEAIAYGFRTHVEIFTEVVQRPNRLVVTNGGSRSRLWREILADVLDRPITSLVDHPGAAFGAAVIAGVGVGRISDWGYVEGALTPEETIEPDPMRASLYHERFQEYQELSDVTTSLSHRIARSAS